MAILDSRDIGVLKLFGKVIIIVAVGSYIGGIDRV